jgi:hypothetical protein
MCAVSAFVDQDIIQELSPDLWSIMMFYIAKCMYPLYKKIQPVLIENKFNPSTYIEVSVPR